MSEENKGEKTLMDKLKHNYRLVVMNNETFEEVGSYRLSLLNVYVIASSIFVLVAILVLILVSLTPLKRYIPGYGDVKEHAELLKLNEELQSMETQLAAQKVYTDNFRKILVGEVEEGAEENAEPVELPDSALYVERIEEDELLRKEIELSEQIEERALLSKAANFKPSEVPIEQLYFIPPVTGIISDGFNPKMNHLGADILAPKNTPIKAIMDGFVFTSDWVLETGNTIGIQHANNLISFYKHNSVLLKKVGSSVKAGEAVAIIGNTGTLSNGPHLHFELWHKGKPINPQDYINFE